MFSCRRIKTISLENGYGRQTAKNAVESSCSILKEFGEDATYLAAVDKEMTGIVDSLHLDSKDNGAVKAILILMGDSYECA